MVNMIVTVNNASDTTKKVMSGNFNLILYTLIASLGYFANGTLVAWTSKFVQANFLLEMYSTQEIASIASSLPLGAAIGSLIVLRYSNIFGRKIWLFSSGFLTIISWLPIFFGYDNFWTFVASRFSAGIAVGVTHFLLPVYVQEIASVHLKPILLNILYVQFAFGILVQYFVGIIYQLDISSIISCMASVLFLIGSIFIPESPEFLYSRGKQNEAKKILEKFYCKTNELENEVQKRINRQNSLLPAKKLTKLSTFIPIIGMTILVQLIGGISIFFYLSSILNNIKSSYSSEFLIISICFILVISIPLFYIFGPTHSSDKKILKWSIMVMFLSLSVLGGFRHMQSILGEPSEYGYIPLVSLCIYTLFYGIGPFRLTSYYIQKITDETHSFKIYGICSLLTWSTIYVLTKIIPKLISIIGVGWLLWYMALLCLVTFFFITIFVPDYQDRKNVEVDLLDNSEISITDISEES